MAGAADDSNGRIAIGIGPVLAVIYAGDVVLVGLGLLREFVARVLGYQSGDFGFRIIALNAELNVPTWYASALFLAIAGLMVLAGALERATARPTATGWFLLGALLVFFSIDETAAIHELTIGPLRDALNLEGTPLDSAWIIPWSVLTIVVAGLCVPFLLRLPRRTAIRLLLAGAVYVVGALGLEVADTVAYYDPAWHDWEPFVAALEETFELIGLTLALRAMLLHITRERGPVSVTLTEESGGR